MTYCGNGYIYYQLIIGHCAYCPLLALLAVPIDPFPYFSRIVKYELLYMNHTSTTVEVGQKYY